jgi:hypothetical protein
MRVILFVPACALALAACVTLDAEGCRNADWYGVGHRDGFAGDKSELERYSAQCAPYGSKPDSANYTKGLEAGRAERAQRRVSLF